MTGTQLVLGCVRLVRVSPAENGTAGSTRPTGLREEGGGAALLARSGQSAQCCISDGQKSELTGERWPVGGGLRTQGGVDVCMRTCTIGMVIFWDANGLF